MSKNLRWRGLTIVIVVVIALLYVVPTLTGGLPQWWPGLFPEEKIHLGLDLQGGMHLVLEVESLQAVENDLERNVGDIKENLREEKIRYYELKRDGVKGINITIIGEDHREPFEKLIHSRFDQFDLKEGGPVEKGVKYTLLLKKEAKDKMMDDAVDQVLETITNRIDQFGVSEPDIRPLEDNRIQIQLPGVQDPERAKSLIGQTAVLEFKIVDDENSLDDALNGNIPTGSEILYEVTRDPATGQVIDKRPFLMKKKAVITGEYLTDARVTRNNQFNQPWVSLTFNSQGARIFKRVTEENLGKRLAVVLDDNVRTVAYLRVVIPNGQAVIEGTFTMEEANDIALVLRAGNLTADVNFIEERTVGPSLGQDSINKGLYSMIVGSIIVIVFMIIYYGLSGIIADIALLLNVVFILAGLAAFEATLTLPGIAGMILTIGMAVDANVLIFERIREELKLGKTPRTAIESGFSKAIITILDANVTTFIAALVLFQFGTGPVKGFAVTLSIGIVASFVTAVFIARFVFDFLYIRLNWKKISI
ncbi:MAG: protein translocase subunit SecD [Desulfobacteraceae bacterium]